MQDIFVVYLFHGGQILMSENDIIRLQADITLGCKARLAFFATMMKVNIGQVIEKALNEYFERQDICAKSSTPQQE